MTLPKRNLLWVYQDDKPVVSQDNDPLDYQLHEQNAAALRLEENSGELHVLYAALVSSEPLSVIRANECETDPSSLATLRFRRLWNEIETLRTMVRLYQGKGADARR